MPDVLSFARTQLQQRGEVIVIAGLLLATLLLPHTVPIGIYGLGIATGGSLALQAIGLVLVYRSERFINFAQPQLGALAGLLFVELVQHNSLLLGLHSACSGCVRVTELSGPTGIETVPVNVSGWLGQTQFWLSLVVAILAAVALGYLVHLFIVRRFRRAPRLVLSVLSIGLAQVFGLLQQLTPRAFSDGTELPRPVPFPFDWGFTVGGAHFGTSDVLTVVVLAACTTGLGLFLSRSRSGVVLRGAADDPGRAETLGVPVARFNTLSWTIATALSAIAAVLAASALGTAVLGSTSSSLRMLAAAVIGGFVSLPLTVAGALAISVFDQSVLWTLKSSAAVDGSLFAVVVISLLLQHNRGGRTDNDAESGWRATREIRPIPAELRQLDVVVRTVRTGTVGLALVLLSLPWVLAPSQTNLAAVTTTFGIVGLSLLVLTGWAGQISLGQFGFAAVGAFVTATLHLPFPLPILIGGLAGSVTAVAVGLPALRLRGLHLAVTTLAFAVAVNTILIDPRYLGSVLPTQLNRPSLLGLDLDDQRVFYYVTLTFLVLSTVAVMGLRRSRTARALIACRDNDAAAQSFGINLVRARLSAFAVSGFFAAMAGGLYAYSQYGVKTSGFGADQSSRMFLMTVIGGLGSVSGPLLGAAYVGATTIFVSNSLVALAATGVGVVALLLVLPGGLGELVAALRDTWLRRIADRYRIEVPSLVEDRRARGERAAIAPKQRPGGGTAYTPVRYRASEQWAVEARHKELARD